MPSSSGGSDNTDQKPACADSEKMESSQLFRQSSAGDAPCVVAAWRRLLVGHDLSSITDDGGRAQRHDRESRLRVDRLDFQDRGEFDQLGLVFVGVVLAEQ